MLGDDVAEQAPLEGIALPLEGPKSIATAVGILGCVGDEATIRQLVSECGVVIESLDRSRNGIHRHSLQPVLTDDDRSPFAWCQIFGKQQDSTGNDVGVNIQDDLVSPVAGFIQQQPGPRIERHRRWRQATDQFVIDHLTIRFGGRLPLLHSLATRLTPQGVTDSSTSSKEFLSEVDQFLQLPLKSQVGIEPIEKGLRGLRSQFPGVSGVDRELLQECQCGGS